MHVQINYFSASCCCLLGFLHPLKLTRDFLKAVVGSPTDTLQILTNGSHSRNTKWSQTQWEHLTGQWTTNSTFTKWKQASFLKGTYLQSGWLQCHALFLFFSLALQQEENGCLMIRFRVVKLAVLSLAVCMKYLNFIIQLTNWME